MYLAGYIEKIGTGTTDVVEACKEAGLGIPVFEQSENFKVIVHRKNVGQSKQTDRYIKIMNTLLANRRTPQKEIAIMLGVSERTINRDLNVIRKSYSIKWIGSPKTGWWEIEKIIPKPIDFNKK